MKTKYIIRKRGTRQYVYRCGLQSVSWVFRKSEARAYSLKAAENNVMMLHLCLLDGPIGPIKSPLEKYQIIPVKVAQ